MSQIVGGEVTPIPRFAWTSPVEGEGVGGDAALIELAVVVHDAAGYVFPSVDVGGFGAAFG